VQRGLIAFIAAVAVGLGMAASAMAADALASTGNATSITPTSADLNGVVYRDHVGARWLFEYSSSPGFNTTVVSTTPVGMTGRLTVVERKVTGLIPATTYYWRVVLVVRSGTRTAQTFGSTQTLETTAVAASTAGTTGTGTTGTATTPASATTTSSSPSPPPTD
jgi:phosphodiesterase/alkaline phosphatase D-like protein